MSPAASDRPDGARGAPVDLAIVAVAALMVIAFVVLLVDLVRQQSWLDVVLLLVGSALVGLCFFLQRWSRPGTG